MEFEWAKTLGRGAFRTTTPLRGSGRSERRQTRLSAKGENSREILRCVAAQTCLLAKAPLTGDFRSTEERDARKTQAATRSQNDAGLQNAAMVCVTVRWVGLKKSQILWKIVDCRRVSIYPVWAVN